MSEDAPTLTYRGEHGYFGQSMPAHEVVRGQHLVFQTADQEYLERLAWGKQGWDGSCGSLNSLSSDHEDQICDF